MKKKFKTAAALLCAALILASPASAEDIPMEQDGAEVSAETFLDGEIAVSVQDIDVPAPSAILVEKETGEVIYEKEPDVQYEPASVTKIMTTLLIAEAVEAGELSLDDMITASSRAASMGGSQVYLEEGERMPLRDMLKCIVVSSANDAAVAVAEHMAGTEQAFAARMNERARELGMVNTNFCNCTGLLDQPEHLTTARDIAIMARELIKHEWIKEYTTIWMDTVRGGEFGLSNTNKLIYYYPGATGLKTGFTSSAMFCLAATAEREGVEYIAVVMHCPTSNERFESAKTLLSYAFANYTIAAVVPDGALAPVRVKLGKTRYVQPELASGGYVLVRRSGAQSLERTLEIESELTAPVERGQKVGTLTISLGGEVLAQRDVAASQEVARLSWFDIFMRILTRVFAPAAGRL